MNLETIKAQNDQLQQIEGEADKLMLESLREMYTGDRSVVPLVIQKDLSELLEKVSDRCRDSGNAIFQTMLKLS